MEAIESGRASTSLEKFRPVWMGIGGTCGGDRTSFNGEAASPSLSGVSKADGARTGGSGGPQKGTPGRGGAEAGRRETSRGRSVRSKGNEAEEVGEEIYLARVNWLQDGSLCAQVQNRSQTELRLLRLDPETGGSTTLLVEKSTVWINLHHLLRSLPSPAPQVRQMGRLRLSRLLGVLKVQSDR